MYSCIMFSAGVVGSVYGNLSESDVLAVRKFLLYFSWYELKKEVEVPRSGFYFQIVPQSSFDMGRIQE